MANNNNNNPDYIEYYMLRAYCLDNDWIAHFAYCRHCGILFSPDMSFNAYKLKKEYYDLFLCEPCLLEVQKRNGISEKEKIEVYWCSLQSCPELK